MSSSTDYKTRKMLLEEVEELTRKNIELTERLNQKSGVAKERIHFMLGTEKELLAQQEPKRKSKT